MSNQNYGALTDVLEIKTYVQKILDEGLEFAFDIETGYDGNDFEKAATLPYLPSFKVVGISFTNDTSWARYIPLAHDNGVNAPLKATARLLWVLLNSGKGIAHNAPFELQGMARFFREHLSDDTFFAAAVRKSHGFYPVLSDSMVEAFMMQIYQPLGPGGGVGIGLKGLVKHIFGHQMVEFMDLFPEEDSELGPGTKKARQRFVRFNSRNLVPEVIEYACEDSVWCLALHQKHYRELKDQFMFQVEIRLLLVLAEMEYAGLMLDWAEYHRRARDLEVFLGKMNEEIQAEISERLGEVVSVNLGSPKQVAELLYEKLGLPVQLDPKTKRPSTSEVALRGIVKTDPILPRILEWREVAKLKTSYVDKYITSLSYAEDGRAHPNHKQVGTTTGRFSVDHVSYQQWPKPYKYELKSGETFELNYRNFLIAPEDFRIVGYDFSQVELRVLAGMANETALLEAFNTGVDVHSATASTMKKIPLEDVTEKDRADGKTLNFAVVYGSGADNIASMLGISTEEAQKMLDDYFDTFFGLRSWMDARVQEGQSTGYVYTKFGRKTRIWDYVDAANTSERANRIEAKLSVKGKSEMPLEEREKAQAEKEKLLRMSRMARSKGNRMCVNAPVQGGAADYMKIGMVRVYQAIRDAGLEDKIILVMTIHDALEFYVHKSISTQQVIDLIAPQVSFRVEGLPEIRADWHEGRRWGEVVELNLDNNQIVGYSWKKTPYDTLEEAYAAQDAKPQRMRLLNLETGETTNLMAHITMTDMPDEHSWKKFKNFLAERPGPAEVVMHFPVGDKNLDVTALIMGTDVDTIKSILNGAEVEIKNEGTS